MERHDSSVQDACSGGFVNFFACLQYIHIVTAVMLCWCNEIKRRMSVFGVIPPHKLHDPVARIFQRFEAFAGITRAVFQRAEEGLKVQKRLE